MSEFDEQFDELIRAITDRLAADIRAGLSSLRDDMSKATKELGEQIDKGRVLDDVIAIVKLDQVDPDMDAQLLRKIRQLLTGKGLL